VRVSSRGCARAKRRNTLTRTKRAYLHLRQLNGGNIANNVNNSRLAASHAVAATRLLLLATAVALREHAAPSKKKKKKMERKRADAPSRETEKQQASEPPATNLCARERVGLPLHVSDHHIAADVKAERAGRRHLTVGGFGDGVTELRVRE
jgi:hypothetical protein